MPGDFIPRKRADYRDWLQNFSDKITAAGPSLGLSPAEVTALQTTCAAQIARIDAITPVEATLQGLQKAEADGRAQTDVSLRGEIARLKRRSGWGQQLAANLQVITTTPTFDPAKYKPQFKVRIVAGQIRLDWKKKGADGVAVYARLDGEAAWTRIGMDRISPYIDNRPLTKPGVTEVREYKLRGMVKDDEIGLDSDIARVVWAGI